jgi:predicted nucleic acid-binding protein
VAIAGWLVDKSAASKIDDPLVGQQLRELAGSLCICPIGQLEQLYSARSAAEYDAWGERMRASYRIVDAPFDLLPRALNLQRDLAHHHGMWHRVAIPDLLIAETALEHGLGVVHVDADFDRIAEVRPLTTRRLGSRSGRH